MKVETEGLGHDLEIAQADFDFSRFDFGQVAPVNAHPFSHFELSPVLLFAELADARSETHTDIAGHLAIIVWSALTRQGRARSPVPCVPELPPKAPSSPTISSLLATATSPNEFVLARMTSTSRGHPSLLRDGVNVERHEFQQIVILHLGQQQLTAAFQ